MRLAIEELLALGRSKDLHRSVLQALRTRPDGEIALARLVHHAARAADASMVLEYGPQAAQQASQHGAHREAARYYQAVLHYRTELPLEEQARLLDEPLVRELPDRADRPGNPGAPGGGRSLAAGRSSPKQVGDDLRWLSRLYWFQGNKGMADRFAGEAIAVLEPLTAGKELAMAYSNRSQLHMLAEENEAAIAWGKKALELAEALQETEIIVHALTNIGTAEMLIREEGGRARLERALQMAQEQEMHDHVARCYANLTHIADPEPELRMGERYLQDGLAYTTDRDMDSTASTCWAGGRAGSSSRVAGWRRRPMRKKCCACIPARQ